MESRESKKRNKQPFTLWHAAGLLLILLTALCIRFGIHPRYRFVSVGMLVLGALGAWKRNWLFWIVLAVQAAAVIFLWTFPQAGYHIASIVPVAVIATLLVFRFCKKPVKIIAVVVLLFALCALLIVEIPIVASAARQPEPDADYIVVLGAAVYGTEPSITLQHRIEGAARYLEENPRTKVVASGGQGEGEKISEAACIRRCLIEQGIAPERILSEDRSTSTKENLAFSKTVIEADGGSVERVVIVSSGYHLYRAVKTAQTLGIRATGAAGSDGYPIYMFGMYLREAAAVCKLWIFGV